LIAGDVASQPVLPCCSWPEVHQPFICWTYWKSAIVALVYMRYAEVLLAVKQILDYLNVLAGMRLGCRGYKRYQ
jgi:hypothetical protein